MLKCSCGQWWHCLPHDSIFCSERSRLLVTVRGVENLLVTESLTSGQLPRVERNRPPPPHSVALPTALPWQLKHHVISSPDWPPLHCSPFPSNDARVLWTCYYRVMPSMIFQISMELNGRITLIMIRQKDEKLKYFSYILLSSLKCTKSLAQ